MIIIPQQLYLLRPVQGGGLALQHSISLGLLFIKPFRGLSFKTFRDGGAGSAKNGLLYIFLIEQRRIIRMGRGSVIICKILKM